MKGEFDLIQSIKSGYRLGHIGDDCAVLPMNEQVDQLVTSDLLVEDVDFVLDRTLPEFVGHKALAVSLSDVAAMGGTPKWALTSIAVPERLWESDFLERFYKGWHDLAERHQVELVGGDISRISDKFLIDSIVIGEVEKGKALLRSGAKPGDHIFVTGFLGGAAAGLRLLDSGQKFADDLPAPIRHLLLRQIQPIPQSRTANMLRTHGLATSMIDISDGLSSDLSHLLTSSGVGARIDSSCIPVDPAIGSVFPDLEENLAMALHGGEDFELLLTTSPEKSASVRDLGFHHIGEINANVGIIEFIAAGTVKTLEPKGFRHF